MCRWSWQKDKMNYLLWRIWPTTLTKTEIGRISFQKPVLLWNKKKINPSFSILIRSGMACLVKCSSPGRPGLWSRGAAGWKGTYACLCLKSSASINHTRPVIQFTICSSYWHFKTLYSHLLLQFSPPPVIASLSAMFLYWQGWLNCHFLHFIPSALSKFERTCGNPCCITICWLGLIRTHWIELMEAVLHVQEEKDCWQRC